MKSREDTTTGERTEEPGPGLTAAERERLGRALAEALPDAVILSDRDGVIRHWNDGAVRIFGFTRGEALGRSLDIIIPEGLRQRHWHGYARMMETGVSQHSADELLAVPAVAKDGSKRSIQFTVAPVADEEGRPAGVVAVLRDVTASFEEMRRLRRAAGT